MNLINCVVVSGEAMSEGWLSLGASSTHRMSGHNHARCVHGAVVHVHRSSQSRTVLACGS